jgi:hypothetical protein
LGNDTLEKKNCVIFYSCNPGRHVLGVRFYVNSRLLPNILCFVPVNDRLSWIRGHGKFRNYSINDAHAPTEDKDDEEKDNFYLELETIYSQCPKHEYLKTSMQKWAMKKIITPMWEEMDCMRNVMKKGHKLVQFAAATDMINGGTIFTHKNIHKVTWRSPDGVTMNQTDHILIKKKTFL